MNYDDAISNVPSNTTQTVSEANTLLVLGASAKNVQTSRSDTL